MMAVDVTNAQYEYNDNEGGSRKGNNLASVSAAANPWENVNQAIISNGT